MVKAFLSLCFCMIGFVTLAQSTFGEPTYWPEKQAFTTSSYGGYAPSFQVTEQQPNDSLSWFKRKFFLEHFVTFRDSALFLYIDPMLDVQVGKGNFTEDNVTQNGRGIRAGVVIQDKLEAETWLMENQSSAMPYWLAHHQQNQTAVYGYGRSKINKDTSTYDFAWAMARLAVQITPWWTTEIGYGRQHIGNGYRSLLLSNQSIPYPYIKNTWLFKKWTYTHQLSAWNTLVRSGATANTEAPFLMQKNKIETLTYLFSDRFSASYIAGAIWHDNKTYASIEQVGFHAPLPGVTAFYGDSLFQLHGLQANYQAKQWMVYGQVLFGQKKVLNHVAYQLGVLTKIIKEKYAIYLRAEYNFVPSYLYDFQGNSWSHQTYYTGYVGRDGREFLLRAQFEKGKLMASTTLGLGIDHTTKMSSDALLKNASFELQYTINSKSGLAIFAGALYKNDQVLPTWADNEFGTANNTLQANKWINVGVRTSLFRIFQDY